MLLNMESDDIKIVGIHGLGGIGKTTIARAVYNTIFHNFEGYSFIENIQENSQRYGIAHLQNQLIFDILKQKNHNITSVEDGIKVLQQRFRKKKVLIVLDDVDQDINVKCLVGDRKWFGIGSKIIFTSRNEAILCAQEVDAIYKPNVMNFDDSIKLFSHHAFQRDQPPEDYLDLSKGMMKITGGLPLALEVLGSSLFSTEKSIWEDMLKKLQKIPNNNIMKRLKISYDGLDDEEQQMFLDTACFFIGMDKDLACHIWDGCNFSPQIGLHTLCARSLVTISENGKLRMHDLLRDLGREIVRQESIKEPGKRTWIWSQEEVLDVLETQMGTSNVEGLSIDFSHRSRSQCLISGKGFAAMTKLRLLQVDFRKFSRNFMFSFSELRWLSWTCCHEQHVQTNFHPRKLAVLNLSHCEITKKWMGWNCIKMAVHLKYLSLTSCHRLTRTPDLSGNRHLEVFILKYCEKLVEIDTSIGYLRNLVILDIIDCKSLVDLPTEILQLTSLERLDLKGCISVNKLPEKLGHMISLTKLDLSGCHGLESLPNLPRDLEVLILKDCTKLVEIDTSIGYLKNLVKLDMSGCESLVDLPREIVQLTSLKELNLKGCESLNKLPEKMDRMISLRTLDLSGCVRLESLPNLPPSLNSLDASSCQSISSLPMLSSLKNLKALNFTGCGKLLYIPNLPLSLTSLDFSSCSSIRYISDLPPSLTHLCVSDCSSIQYISDLPSSLISLHVSSCGSIRKLSTTSGLRNLETLCLQQCHNLEKFEGVDKRLDSQVLFTMQGSSLKKFKKLAGWKNLKKLILFDCGISDIEFEDKGIDSLEELQIVGCLALKTFPDLSNLNKLQVLTIADCGKLTEIPGLDRLKSLIKFSIGWCMTIQRLPDLSNLKNLHFLYITECQNLTKIHGVDRLDFLEQLYINECESLGRLPDLSNLKNLWRLTVQFCKKLTEIQAVNGSDRVYAVGKSLILLNTTGSTQLEKFPDLNFMMIKQQAYGGYAGFRLYIDDIKSNPRHTVSHRRISSRSDLLRRGVLFILGIYLSLFLARHYKSDLIRKGALVILGIFLFILGAAFTMTLFMWERLYHLYLKEWDVWRRGKLH